MSQKKAIELVRTANSMSELISIVSRLRKPRPVVQFGVTKISGESLQNTRRAANDTAVALLNSLPADFDGRNLTDEQRKILAAYTGEGGLKGEGGSQYEYYTPQFMAEGIWDLFSDYGITGGHVLEPSAGPGIFQETKLPGMVMTSAELSPVSGRINQLLHPEDAVNIGPFEALAAREGEYDHAIANVPFGEGRSGVAGLDTAYAKERNVGCYFVLRTIDKVKAGGLIVLVVPNGMTDGKSAKYMKLRDQVSRKAEFMGAHRMPSGTFSESGTETVVDVWVLRKHPAEFADIIPDTSDTVLKSASVLWDTYLKGRWFKTSEGRKFIHGDEERQAFQNRLVVKKNNTISNGGMKMALSRRFHSRIDWDQLGVTSPAWQGAQDGDKRLVGGIWHTFEAGRWVKDNTTDASTLNVETYGAASIGALKDALYQRDAGLIASYDQIAATVRDYPSIVPDELHGLMRFAQKQKQGTQARILRGAVIGRMINTALDLRSAGMDADGILADAARYAQEEVARYGNPCAVKLEDSSGSAAKDWLTFTGNITRSGDTSDLLKGKIDVTEGAAGVDFTKPEQVLAHLFNDIAMNPVTLDDFREVFTGDLPINNDAALQYLAGYQDIAIDGSGCFIPMSRASSGNVAKKIAALVAWRESASGAVRDNMDRQIALIQEKRIWTPLNNIKVNLNARWIDRRLIKEFLAEQGYDEFKYTRPDFDVEDGVLVSPDNYNGKDGVFTGYQLRTVVNKSGKHFKKASNKDGFLNQLENYLNGVKPRGTKVAEYMDKIAGLEGSFNDWLRSHPDVEQIESDYNDAFNAYIPFAHSSAPLGLSGISGERMPMTYQNEEVRRLSEDGRGIMGFGTGLGKTTTALALEAYNFETGRTKRTCIVVPKAVYQNWYHEAQSFYSESAFSAMMFVGLDEVKNKDGVIETVPVLDGDGEPRTGKKGQLLTRNQIKDSSSATILQRMNMIPSSNWRTVVMTKEQFASIPLRDATIEINSQQELYKEIEVGRLDMASDKHRDAAKRNRIMDRGANTGSNKKENIPYFEDMSFDSVIADEGHNYRNSLSAGREASSLAYLPTGAVSKMARDMNVKAAYLMRKNNGRGVVMLTATPLVNSPIDAFNMLSTVVAPEEWLKMGIAVPDDFVRVFGKTANVQVQKISGEVVEKQGLVGFQNLDGLRGIFHRWTTLKNADDVGQTVKIPDVVEGKIDVPMTAEQKSMYEVLRLRAKELSDRDAGILMDNKLAVEDDDDDDEEKDFIFSIIRDMDKVAIDPELYLGSITFRFDPQDAETARGIFESLPVQAGGKLDDDEDEDEEDDESGLVSTRSSKVVETTFTEKNGIWELCASITLEKDILAAIDRAGLDKRRVTHPIPPKYAALIENLRQGLENGKQIIFVDEKSQHGKLKRIIASALQMDVKDIGIINATSVSERSTVKIKKVPCPKEPEPNKDGEYKKDQLEDYYTKLAKYEDYISAKMDAGLSGMEGIAADYNEGRTRIVICNKKAEVGINLHIGTTDIHHLTFPWTPASVDQRNGRGARVGAPQDKVNVHYYCGKGTFDDFRIDTLKRKKNWIRAIMNTDIQETENGNASDSTEQAIMLASNPEERRALIARQETERREAIRRKQEAEANASLDIFLKTSSAMKTPVEQLESNQERTRLRYEEAQAQLNSSIASGTTRNGQAYYIKSVSKTRKEFYVATTALKRAKGATNTLKKSRGDVERAIKSGVLNIDRDVLDNPAQYQRTTANLLLRVGGYYRVKIVREHDSDQFCVASISSLDAETAVATIKIAWEEGYDRISVGLITSIPFVDVLEPVAFDEDTAKLYERAVAGISIESFAMNITRDDFYKTIASGHLCIQGKRERFSSSSVDYWPYRDDSGEIKLRFVDKGRIAAAAKESNGEPGIRNDQWIYPDPNDEALKFEVCKLFKSGQLKPDHAEGFLKAVFGDDVDQGMEKYGEQASFDDVMREFRIWDKERAKEDEDGESLFDVSADDIRCFGNDPTGDSLERKWKNRFFRLKFRSRMSQYSNVKAIMDMFIQAQDSAISQKIDKARDGVKSLIADFIKQYQRLTEKDGWDAMNSTSYQEPGGVANTIKEALNVLDTPAALWIKAGEVLNALPDGDISSQTVTSFADIARMASLAVLSAKSLRSGNYKEMLPEDMEGTDWDSFIEWKTGTDSQEIIAQRLAVQRTRREQEAKEAEEQAKQAVNEAYTITVNQGAIQAKTRMRGRWWSVSHPANSVFLVADVADSGVTRKAKDRIKALGGKFWNFEVNPVSGVDFDRPAWMIPVQIGEEAIRRIMSN